MHITAMEWKAPISQSEMRARANGRRRWVATVKFRARVRRQQVATRLYALRQEARAQPLDLHGPITRCPRWIPRGAVRQLAQEFQVHPGTMRRDIQAIEREELKAFDARPLPPRQRIRDPRFQWARERRHPMPRRVTVRLPEPLCQRLTDAGEVSRMVRRAVEGYLDTQSSHTTHACALTILDACDPETADRLVTTAEGLGMPLAGVIAAVLCSRLREGRSSMPDEVGQRSSGPKSKQW